MPKVMRSRSLAGAVAAAIAVVFALGAGTAWAHDPIILTPEQSTPAAGPLLVDGTISFALYGDVTGPGDTRAFRVRYAAGQTFNLSALVPNLEPEKGLAVGEYPTITVVTPSGENIVLQPGMVSTFDEPFTKTSYRQYLEWSTTAVAGDYGVIITGVVPARFTIATGVIEQFGTAVENVSKREGGIAEVMKWYSTPPASSGASTTVPPTTLTPSTTAPATSAPATSAPATSTTATEGSSSDGGQGSTLIIVPVIVVAVGAGLAIWLARRRR